MNNFRIIIFAAIFCVSTISVFAQHGKRGMPPGGMDANAGTIVMKVIDAQSQQAIEYANISVFSANDSSLITGSISSKDGRAMIKSIPFGKYYVTVDFIGYKMVKLNDINLSKEKPFKRIGIVKLNPAAEILEGVEIEAERKHIEYKIDKKIINVSKDLTSLGGSAVDALENTPSVQTDIEGNVMLRGSSSFTVLIDGKPTPLEGSEALQQIPASAIENIEIITNPSAKFDPDGVAGIINIVMKKEMQRGVNGNFNLSYGTYHNRSADFLVNARTGKFNFFVGGNYRVNERRGNSSRLNARYLDTINFITDSKGEGLWGHNGYNGRVGFDYYMNDNNIFTLSGEYGRREYINGGKNNFDEYLTKNDLPDFSDPTANHTYYRNDNNFNVKNDYYRADLNYQHKFNSDGHEIQAYAQYSGNMKTENSGFDKTYTNSSFEAIAGVPQEREKSFEDGDNYKFTGRIDYTNPFSENGKFETGYQLKSRRGISDYSYSIYDGNNFIDDQSQANNVDFNRDIHSVYATFTNQILKFDYQLGLRGEYTKRTFISNTLNKTYDYEDADLFPTVHISRKLKHDIQMQASYTKRIRRPRGWFLDPFRTKNSDYSYSEGNPLLEPSYTNSFEINAQKRIGAHFISLETFYRQTYNSTERVSYQDATDPRILISRFENIGSNESFGLELMGNFNFITWWNMNLTGDVYRYSIDANSNNENLKSSSTISYSARFNNTFKIKKTNTRFQLFAMYNGPSITAQGERGSFFTVNAGVRQEFLKRKLSVLFSLDDIFGTRGYNGESFSDGFYSEFDFSPVTTPMLKLTVTYRLNDYERRRENRDDMDMESGGGMM